VLARGHPDRGTSTGISLLRVVAARRSREIGHGQERDEAANVTADVVDTHFAAKRRNRSSRWFSACPVIKPSSQMRQDEQALVARIDAPIKQTRVPALEARGGRFADKSLEPAGTPRAPGVRNIGQGIWAVEHAHEAEGVRDGKAAELEDWSNVPSGTALRARSHLGQAHIDRSAKPSHRGREDCLLRELHLRSRSAGLSPSAYGTCWRSQSLSPVEPP
jgi:hypothetical protein